MKAVVSAIIVVSVLSLTGGAWLLTRQRPEQSPLLILLEPRTTGQDFIFREGQPLILIGFHPEEGVHRVELQDGQGRSLWTHQLREGEELGNARLSADGKYLVYDYYIFKPPRGWLYPHEEVRYRGGIRCVRQDGTIVWESRSQGISEGSPSCSPEGCVEQVAGNQVLIARHGWEIIERITVRNLARQGVRYSLALQKRKEQHSRQMVRLWLFRGEPDVSHIITGHRSSIWRVGRNSRWTVQSCLPLSITFPRRSALRGHMCCWKWRRNPILYGRWG
jgi:hypothetical protein